MLLGKATNELACLQTRNSCNKLHRGDVRYLSVAQILA